jgi:transcriptional regulator with XRE-family HTH domain
MFKGERLVVGEPIRLPDGHSMQSTGLHVKPPIDSRNPVDSAQDRKAFGERVLRARLELGARQRPPRSVSQSEIGEALGVSGVAVGSWEAGRKVPDLGTVQKLAFVLGIRAAWLAFGEEPMRPGEAPAPDPLPQRNARRG